MKKVKLYPYGDIPDVDVVKQFQTGHSPIVRASTSVNESVEEDIEDPMTERQNEMDSLYAIYKDWTSVYAFYNMD